MNKKLIGLARIKSQPDKKALKLAAVEHRLEQNVVSILQDVYLNEQEVAAITGFSLSKLRNDRHLRRGLPYLKVDRSVRYRLSDVQNVMEQCRVTFQEA